MTGKSASVMTMPPSPKHAALQDLMQIPGVGRQVAQDLYELGYRSVEDLRGEDPECMYEALCAYQRVMVDRCMLYVFRCAVYYASTDAPDPDLLKWWRWKDVPQETASQGRRRMLPSHEFAELVMETTH
ncbi:MAG: helix-hairpin-helix domain-containing protein [Anaerolineae bacterium]